MLVGSGGLGREVNPLLSLRASPAPTSCCGGLCGARAPGDRAVGSGAARLGLHPAPVVAELWRGYASLGDDAARSAFLRTVRAVVDPRGQAVSASNRLAPGRRGADADRLGRLRPDHPRRPQPAAHAALPGSRLEIFEGVGHYPHCEAPGRFVDALQRFLDQTEPADFDRDFWAARFRAAS